VDGNQGRKEEAKDKENDEEIEKPLAEKLKKIRQQEGLQAASMLLSRQSSMMASQLKAMQI